MVAQIKNVPGPSDEYGWLSPPRRYLLGPNGYFRPERKRFRQLECIGGLPWQTRALAWLRDHVSPNLPRAYYHLVLGHDLHLAVWASLYARQFHASPELPTVGWWEDIGLVSVGKVTTAFRDFECLNLVTDTTAYGDFKFHEVGVSTTAEANSQTALVTTSGIARQLGTQINPQAYTYQTSAIITADAIETWAEHGLFNAAVAGTMLDRSLLSPTIAVQVGDSVEFTYVLTKSAEP